MFLKGQIKISLLVIVAPLFTLVNSAPTIINPPSSVNVTVANYSFAMECTAQSADEVLFIINETIANEGVEGFNEGLLITNGNIKTRTLTVTVSLSISNTNISCLAFKFINNVAEVLSKPALILVKGALDLPTVTDTTIINSTVSISWEAPPTLEGTVINGYYISSTSGDSLYTEDTSITLPITDPDPCGVNISIIPYNGINGTAAEVDGIIIPSIPNDVVPVSVVLNQSQEVVNLMIHVDITNLCPGEYPDSVLINITDATESIGIFGLVNFVLSSRSILDANISIILNTGQEYNITVIPRNVLGSFESSKITLKILSTTQSSTVTSPTSTFTDLSSEILNSITINMTGTGEQNLNVFITFGVALPAAIISLLLLIMVLVIAVSYILYKRKLHSTDKGIQSIDPDKAIYYSTTATTIEEIKDSEHRTVVVTSDLKEFEPKEEEEKEFKYKDNDYQPKPKQDEEEEYEYDSDQSDDEVSLLQVLSFRKALSSSKKDLIVQLFMKPTQRKTKRISISTYPDHTHQSKLTHFKSVFNEGIDEDIVPVEAEQSTSGNTAMDRFSIAMGKLPHVHHSISEGSLSYECNKDLHDSSWLQ